MYKQRELKWKTCTGCGDNKTEEHFPPNANCKGGRSPECRTCKRIRSAKKTPGLNSKKLENFARLYQ